MDIKILRLHNGEDIISGVSVVEDGYILESPMSFYLKGSTKVTGETVVMDHWLPLPLTKENTVSIRSSDVVFQIDPTEDFMEFYSNTVEMLNKALGEIDSIESINNDSVNKLSEDEMSYILENMDQLYGPSSKGH